jgi:hypothetical protein
VSADEFQLEQCFVLLLPSLPPLLLLLLLNNMVRALVTGFG